VQEKHREAKTLWSFPLGHAEKNESIREAARREGEEETGHEIHITRKQRSIIIKATDFKSSHQFMEGRINLTIFYGSIGKKLSKAAELPAQWFSLKEISALPLRGEWIKEFLPNRI
jgi:8-oxo-dGTP pyrophosphatase MutT (NUDIX family)